VNIKVEYDREEEFDFLQNEELDDLVDENQEAFDIDVIITTMLL